MKVPAPRVPAPRVPAPLRLSALLLVAATPAAAIEGRYRVEGNNPGQSASYQGEAVVRRTGETYTVAWQVGTSRQIGTGLVLGQTFTVAFRVIGGVGSGIATYAIVDGRVADGAWANLNARDTGRERWTPTVAE